MVGRERKLAYAAFLAVCLIWSTTYLGIKIALETIPPFLLGGTRFVVSGMILVLLVRARGVSLPRPSTWPSFALAGLLLLGVGNGGVMFAEQVVSSGMAAVTVATTPFWMVGIGALVPHGERITRRAVAGLILGFIGVLLLAGADLQAGMTSGSLSGLLTLEVACAGWAAGTVLSKRRHTDQNPFGAAAIQMLAGGAVMLLLSTVLGEWRLVSFTARTVTALVYLTIAGSLVGFACYVYALRHLPVSTVSLYAYVNPVLAVALGALLLSEPVTLTMILAMILILAGMAVVSAPGGSAAVRALWWRKPQPVRQAQTDSSAAVPQVVGETLRVCEK
ncbi:MAG: EamA family transporter [Luteitalea sp.]|nr:EamA family transporter [Luteitalea sp.]